MTTVNVQDPIYQVLWEHVGTRLNDGKFGCRCGICLPNVTAHLQHLADVIRVDSPAGAEKCIRCGGTDDLKDRGMAPGVTFCKWCREALAWRDRALSAEEAFDIVSNAVVTDLDPDRSTAEQIAELLERFATFDEIETGTEAALGEAEEKLRAHDSRGAAMTESQAGRITYMADVMREHKSRGWTGKGWSCTCGYEGEEWHEHIALALLRADFEWSEGFYTWDECDDGGPCPRCDGRGRQYFVKLDVKR